MHTTSLNVSHVHAICPSVCYNSVVRLFYSVIVLYGACPVLFTYRSMDTTTHRIVHFRGSRKCAIRCASRSIYLTLNESHDEPYRAFQGPPEMRDTVRVPFCSSTTDDNHNAPHRAFPGVPEMCDTVRVLFYSTTAQ